MSWRQFVADPWVSAALAALVLVSSFLLTAAPRALEDVNERQLTSDVADLSALQRDVTGRWQTSAEPPITDEEGQRPDQWGPFLAGAEAVRSAQPEPLRSVLGPPQILAAQTSQVQGVPEPETGYWAWTATVYADPSLPERVELVEGTWPRPELLGDAAGGWMGPDRAHGREEEAEPGEAEPGEAERNGAEVLILDEAAEMLHLSVGDQLNPDLVISGTYRPTDPDDPRWQHVDNAVEPAIMYSPNRGESVLTSVFLHESNRGAITQPAAMRMQVWFPVDAGRITGSRLDPAVLRTQLTGMIAQEHVLVPKGDAALGYMETDQIPIFDSDLTTMLDTTVRQQRATSSLLAVVAAGPLGVTLAVLALAARLVVHRRRPALAMTLARGASTQQLRTLVALEGLLVGVPAAVLGHVLARLLLPGPGRWWEWLITAVVALAPAAALALSLEDASLLQERRDLSGRSSSRWRWVAEAAVIALAGLATWRLLDRGARGDDAAESGIDLLAAAAPILLALAAAVVALRIYPLPLAALTGALRGGRGLTPFLGAARALRDPAGGLVPALAVVLGTTIALVSAVLLTTVTTGAEKAAWQNHGADVRALGPVMSDEAMEQIAEVPGVQAVARIRDLGSTLDLSRDGERNAVRLLLVDPELEQVLGGGSGASSDSQAVGPGPEFYAASGGAPKVLVGGSAEIGPGPATLRSVEGEVEVLGRLEQLPGVATPGSWVLLDRTHWEASGRTTPLARTALIATSDGADRQAVADAVSEILGPSVVTTVDGELDDFTSAPVTAGLRAAFIGATVLTGLLTVLAIVVVQLMGATSRMKLFSVLRTLGLGRGQTRTLTAWELAPLLVTSLVVGAVLGLVVPWVLARTLDLRGLTGGRSAPDLTLDPLVVVAVLGGVVLTVLLATTVSAWLAGRTNLAQALRVGEER